MKVRVVLGLSVAMIALTAKPALAALPVAPDQGVAGFNGTVRAVTQVGSTVYVGGDFTQAVLSDGTQTPRQYLAAIDASTGALTAWQPLPNDQVFAIDSDPATGDVYVGGAFTAVGGSARRHLAAFGPSGTLLSWHPSTSASVRAVDVSSSGVIYVGGSFSFAAGSSRSRLAAFDRAGGLLSWSPAANAAVYDLEIGDDGRVYVGGNFTTIDGTSTGHLVPIDQLGVAHPWADKIPDEIFALTEDGGVVYSAAGGGGGQVYADTASVGTRLWKKHGDGDVQAIDYVPTENAVVAGGHFVTWDGQSQAFAVELEASGGALTSWRPTLNHGIWAVFATSTSLYLGGKFTSISGVKARRLARFTLT
jgi:hypothetical protein